MKNACDVCLLDSDGEDGVTPATVLVHVMAAHCPVGLPLSHQLVHLEEREEKREKREKESDAGQRQKQGYRRGVMGG
jgi:hypothetical protein